MKHDPSTEGIKARLAGWQHAFVPGHPGALKPRAVIAAHAGVQSVSTDAGAKPHAHDGANAKANDTMAAFGSPRFTNKPGQIVASTKTN